MNFYQVPNFSTLFLFIKGGDRKYIYICQIVKKILVFWIKVLNDEFSGIHKPDKNLKKMFKNV